MVERRSGLSLVLLVCTAFLALDATACTQSGGAAPERVAGPPIETESDTAIVRLVSDSVTGSIIATYTNRSSTPVYLGGCGGSYPSFTLDKSVGGRWVVGYELVCMLGGTAPIEVRAGQARTDTLPLRDFRSPHSLPRFTSSDIPGTYRIVYEAYDCCSTPPGGGVRHGARLPREDHVSKAFRIEVGQ